MAKAAEDDLEEYRRDGFDDSYHKKYLEKMRDEANFSLFRNKSKYVLYAQTV